MDDKEIYGAMRDCINYLRDRFSSQLKGWTLEFRTEISYQNIMEVISNAGVRRDFDIIFNTRKIKPDGGVITLKRENQQGFGKIVLVSEVKRQGTNDERAKEGKPRQSQGNAIERLGKNLTGIKAMMNHEQITPFVCFGWGCDFVENYGDDFVMAKVSMLNEFYRLNKINVYKKDGTSDKNSFSPVSMFFREERWTRPEMFEILKEIGEDSIRYYLH